VRGDVVSVEQTGEGDVHTTDGDGAGASGDVEVTSGEESGERVAGGKAEEVRDREAARDDVEAEGVGVRRRRLGHVKGEEGGIDGGEEGEGTAVSGVVSG